MPTYDDYLNLCHLIYDHAAGYAQLRVFLDIVRSAARVSPLSFSEFSALTVEMADLLDLSLLNQSLSYVS